VLGDTFYRVPGIAMSADDPHEMDSFWTSPPRPDPALAERFVAHLRAEALLPGSFYDPTTWELLCDHVAQRVRSAMPAPARPLPQLVTVPSIPRSIAPAAEPAVALPAWRPSFLPVLPRPGLDPAE
jgi:hypothetical protein